MGVHTNLNDFQNAVKSANPNSIVELKPGIYDGDVKLDYRSLTDDIKVIMDGVTINSTGVKGLYAVDVTGNHIFLQADGLKINGGKMGGLGVRGHNLTLLSDLNGYITNVGIGIFMQGTNHLVQGFNVDNVRSTGLSGHGFPINEKNNYSRGFGYHPENNWRISQCIFQNIEPPTPGDAGGGVRLIPHNKNIVVDNCIYRNIKGSGLWVDHGQKGFEFYYNHFENIDYKGIFFEIADPDPNDTSGFVAKFAGNTFGEGVAKHPILIAASSGQNPGGIEVFGNEIRNGWGIVAGAMERRFARRFDKSKPEGWEWVDARLENISIHHNLIKPTTGRNHISMYEGPQSGLIEIDNNYYVTGHNYNWNKPNGTLESKEITEGKVFVGGDKMNPHGIPTNPVTFFDKNAIIGEEPIEFPFPEIYAEIPVQKVDIESGVVIDIPDPDPIITDPPVSNDIPDVWIVSDYSSVTDKDDFCAMAFALLCAKDRYNIKGITVGAHPLTEDFSNPLDIYNETHGKALKEELGIEYPVYLADNWGNRFKNTTYHDDNIVALIEEIRLHSEENPLYILNWGPTTEIAVLVRELLENDRALLDNFVIISHFTAKPTDNNYRKDLEASEYIKEKAFLGDVYFIELDRGGADKIDDKTFPKMDSAILNSKIGHYFGEKWQNNKPDFSDGATLVALAFPELGFGKTFIDLAKKDGTTNLALFNGIFANQKGKLYQIIEKYGRDAVLGTDDPVIVDPVVTDPPVVIPDLDKVLEWAIIAKENAEKIIDELS